MNHYEVRSEYSNQIGQALAQTYDRNLFSLAVKAALNPTTIGLGVADQGNAEALYTGANPNADAWITQIFAAAQKLDEKNVPEDNRYVFVNPALYWALVQNDKLLNRDFGPGNGAYKDGEVLNVAGMSIVKTNNLTRNFTSASEMVDYGTKYQVDASNCRALVMHPQAMGTVQLLGVASEMEYQIERQGTLMVSKMAVGHGILRPECIVAVIGTAAP
jgi:hypothetical protein